MQYAESYVRRERWRARLLAVEIVNTLGEAMAGGEDGPERVAPGRMLAQMGITLE